MKSALLKVHLFCLAALNQGKGGRCAGWLQPRRAEIQRKDSPGLVVLQGKELLVISVGGNSIGWSSTENGGKWPADDEVALASIATSLSQGLLRSEVILHRLALSALHTVPASTSDKQPETNISLDSISLFRNESQF